MGTAMLLWLTLEGIGLLSLPLARFLFARLPGGGLALARPLGILVLVYPAWLLASLHLAPYGAATMYVGVGALAILSAALAVRRRHLTRLRSAGSAFLAGTPGRLWLAGEVIFTVAFFGWALMRSYSPDVWGTEKPMDMAFVNAVNRSEWFPPHDPWLAGEDLNYYYFGHYVVAFFVRLLGIEPTAGYNLAVALFFALCATAVFAVASALYLGGVKAGAPARSPILVGATATLLAVGVGNLAGGFQLLDDRGPLRSYDWWAPSRVIDGSANEFPYFSFLLGDLHAHVMAVPFALAALAFAIQIAYGGPRLPHARTFRAWIETGAELLLAALVLGALVGVSSLDYATSLVLVVLCVVLWATRDGEVRRPVASAAWASSVAIASLALFLPFLIDYRPDASGIALVGDHVRFTAFARDYLLIYGLPLGVLASLFVHRSRESRTPRRYYVWGGVAAGFVLVLLAPSNLAGLALALGVAAFALYTALDPQRSQPYRCLWLLVTGGLGLLAISELVYIRDAFAGTASYRFNTIFKLGFQAWWLLAVAAACAVFWSAAWLSRKARAAWGAGVAALAALALVYPVAGSVARTGGFSSEPALDGLRWLAERAPGDAAAIRWLSTNVEGSPTILEAFGDDFSPAGHARVSTFTGLPTVIGWTGHEVQWAHDPGTRPRDVRMIYSTRNLRRARALLERYGVSYVFVGSLERADYPASGIAKFSRLGTRVFSRRGTSVFRMA